MFRSGRPPRSFIVRSVCLNRSQVQRKSRRETRGPTKTLWIMWLALHTTISGAALRTGWRQSIPFGSIESCAGVSDTTPPVACGQINRPRSSLLAKRQSPSPSNQSTLIRSAAPPAKHKHLPRERTRFERPLHHRGQPDKPRRMSVMSATIQMRVPARSPIIRPEPPVPCGLLLDQRLPECERSPWPVQSEWSPRARLNSRPSPAPLSPVGPPSPEPRAAAAYAASPPAVALADTSAAKQTLGWR